MTFKHALKEIPSYDSEKGVTKRIFEGEGIRLILWKDTKDRSLVSFEIKFIPSLDTSITIHWNANSALGSNETFSVQEDSCSCPPYARLHSI